MLLAETVFEFDPNLHTGWVYFEKDIFQLFGIFVLIIHGMVGRGEEGIPQCSEEKSRSTSKPPELQQSQRGEAQVFRMHLN